MEFTSDEEKRRILKAKSLAGKKGGAISGKITGKINGLLPLSNYSRITGEKYSMQLIDLPIYLLDSMDKLGKRHAPYIVEVLLPEIERLERLECSFISEYLLLLHDKEFRLIPKRAVTLHRHFLERIEKLVGKTNRAKFITAYLERNFRRNMN